MPRARRPPVRRPCERCKAKHVRCDDDHTSCRRCLAKNLNCIRVTKPTVFLPGSSARYDSRFSGRETWVSDAGQTQHVSPQSVLADSPDTYIPTTSPHDQLRGTNTCPPLSDERDATVQASPRSFDPPFVSAILEAEEGPVQYDSPWTQTGQLRGDPELFPLEPLDTTRACLLQYFVDHLSSWFDTCDERKHFQIFVPIWARHYLPLLDAICATSSRHLCRVDQYATVDGFQYEGQILTGLTAYTAVEYMLACIPALRDFHTNHDKEHRKLIVATAIILRQFEEMDDGNDQGGLACLDSSNRGDHHTQVNFLDIINAIIRSSYEEGNFNRHEFLDVAYWICLRQEVYSAFTQKRSPQMLLAPEQWTNAAAVNKMVMHAAQVAKWLFDERSVGEWNRLYEQQELLERNVLSKTRYLPILKQPPNRTKGDVFPTIWYGSDLVVTGVQHVMIARMVLTAEAPEVSVSHDRNLHRKIEADVRKVILNLCGTAKHRPSCPPAFVNATMGILLYGDFFTEECERQALAGVVASFCAVKAWPLPEALRSFT